MSKRVSLSPKLAILLAPAIAACSMDTVAVSASDEVAVSASDETLARKAVPRHFSRSDLVARGPWRAPSDGTPEPDPVDPDPVDPVEPDPVEPDPVDPDPVDPDPVDTGTDEDTGTPAPTGRLSAYTLYVDPSSNASRQASTWRTTDPEGAMLMDRMAANPIGLWIGDWWNDVAGTVDDAVTEGGDQLRVLVAYNIPHRDCGAWSAGGSENKDAYAQFIADMARGLNGRKAIVVLEPDAVPLTHCLTDAQATERFEMMSAAVDTLTAAGALVYIDAGDSAWLPADEIADRLVSAGVHRAAGFSLNVSHTETTENEIAYAEEIRAILGDVHYTVDTHRNGVGPTDDHEWCNPQGVAVGADPTLNTTAPGLDALLWVKPPGESDGSCNGGPIAGAWWPSYARALAALAWL